MYENLDDFPALIPLCKNWQEVQKEVQKLMSGAFIDWPEEEIYEGDWQVFSLYNFGKKSPFPCAVCPRTTALIESVPGLWMAGFSKMKPGTHIQPHHGYTGEVLRFHLGLIGGDDCGLRVGSETRGWHPGSAFVFDDTQEHEAWNKGTEDRIILLMDFRRDPDSTAEITHPPFDNNISYTLSLSDVKLK